MPRVRWSGPRWPKSLSLMTSLIKIPYIPIKNFFRVQATRLAKSFEHLTGSVVLIGLEIFLRKATCDPAVFAWTAWINPDAKVLKLNHSYCNHLIVVKTWKEIVSSILSSLVKKNLNKFMCLPNCRVKKMVVIKITHAWHKFWMEITQRAPVLLCVK